jgi:hypothetical protein
VQSKEKYDIIARAAEQAVQKHIPKSQNVISIIHIEGNQKDKTLILPLFNRHSVQTIAHRTLLKLYNIQRVIM